MLQINARTLSESIIVEFGNTAAELSPFSSGCLLRLFLVRPFDFHTITKIASKLSLALNLKLIKEQSLYVRTSRSTHTIEILYIKRKIKQDAN